MFDKPQYHPASLDALLRLLREQLGAPNDHPYCV